MRRLIAWLDRKPGRVAEAGLAGIIVCVVTLYGLAYAGTELAGYQNGQSVYQAMIQTIGAAVQWVGDVARSVAAQFR